MAEIKENNEQELVTTERIQSLIYTMRNLQVMVDSDLAFLYGVETRTLNQAVKRNKARFPERYCFQLSKEEYENLKSQNVCFHVSVEYVFRVWMLPSPLILFCLTILGKTGALASLKETARNSKLLLEEFIYYELCHFQYTMCILLQNMVYYR